MTVSERRTDLAKRRRIDALFDRVRVAREEVVRTGLGAVHGMGGAPPAPRTLVALTYLAAADVFTGDRRPGPADRLAVPLP